MKSAKLFLLSGVILLSFTGAAFSDTYVEGYYRKDGTYVEPHYRSDSNGSKNDNWSTKGNINPYTGAEGTKDPDYSYSGSRKKK